MNWRPFMRWNTRSPYWNTGIRRLRSNWNIKRRPDVRLECCIRRTSSSCAPTRPAGRSGRWKKTCDDWLKPSPIATARRTTAPGVARLAKSMRASSACTTACALRRRSTGSSNATSFFWKITSAPIPLRSILPLKKPSGAWSPLSQALRCGSCCNNMRYQPTSFIS